MSLLRRVWSWVLAAVHEAFEHGQGYPDPEDGYPGKVVKSGRPHLVPIGMLIVLTPFVAGACLLDRWLLGGMVPVPFLTMWTPFAVAAVAWSIGLYLTQRRR